jgi:hypothetical protein
MQIDPEDAARFKATVAVQRADVVDRGAGVAVWRADAARFGASVVSLLLTR